MLIDVLTLFPQMFAGVLGSSILKRAQDKGLVRYKLHQLRDYSKDPHRKVDDRPFGGGPGMVLMCQPMIDAVAAIEAAEPEPATRVIPLPDRRKAHAGPCRGIEQTPASPIDRGPLRRFRRADQDDPPALREISIGDFILSGGELPAMVLLDAIVRLLPGALGDELSTHGESFGTADATIDGGLEYPHYTRPRDFLGNSVPDILLSGDHAEIEKWRRQQARKRTAERRPDLLK